MSRWIFQLWFLMGLLFGASWGAQAQGTWDPESPPEPGQLSVTLVSLPAGCANFSQTHVDGRYERNEAVTVRVTPYNDYDFVAWLDEGGNEVSQVPEYAFTVEKNRKLTALLAFNPKDNPTEPGNGYYKLITQSSPDNGGLVNQFIGEDQTTGLYQPGTKVTLRASAYPDYDFSHWEEQGVKIGEAESLEYTMPRAHAYVTAVFTWNPESPAEPGQSVGWLYVKRNLNEAGNVSQSGNGVYAMGSVVQLVASPAYGYRFLGWYEGNTLLSELHNFSYTIAKNRTTLEARFAQVTTPVDPGNPDGPGTNPDPGTPEVPDYPEIPIQVDPSTSNQGSVQVEGVMRPGQKVTIKAEPKEGFAFEGWYINGVLVEDAEMVYQFIVEHTMASVTVKFREIPFQLLNNRSQKGLVQVTKLRGNTAHLSAGPLKGHYFDGWYLAGKLLSKLKEYDFDITQLTQLQSAPGTGTGLRATTLPVIEAVYLEGTDAIEPIDAAEWLRVERQADGWQLVIKQPIRRLRIYRLTGQCLASWQVIPAGSVQILPYADPHFIVWIETDQGWSTLKQ